MKHRPNIQDFKADAFDFAEEQAARRLALRKANRMRRELGMPPLSEPKRPVARPIPVVRDKDGNRLHPDGLRALAKALSTKIDTTTRGER